MQELRKTAIRRTSKDELASPAIYDVTGEKYMEGKTAEITGSPIACGQLGMVPQG